MALLATVSVVAGCASRAGGQGAATASGHAHGSASAARSTASPARTGTPARTATPGAFPTVLPVPPPPASLHQTRAFPSAHTAAFHTEITDLWAAVLTGKAGRALQAFFPLAAYTQVKAIADPAADWHNRLFGDFRLDVAAAHRFLGRGASHAQLVRVIVPAGEAAWINPGVCSNDVGYWHVAGARIVYRQHGQVRSIGIASLISWRGRWYVVHFGAVLRNGNYGIVDSPAAGPGIPGPPGGC